MFDFLTVFIIGLISAGAIAFAVFWFIRKGVMLKWYEWLMSVLGFILLVIAIQHYLGATNEQYSTAAWMGLLIIGLPALILLALPLQLAWKRKSHT